MFILFPIGRKTTLSKFPYFTVGLIILNVLVFILTWPGEKRFLNERVSFEQFSFQGQQLVDILISEHSGITQTTRILLQNEKKSPDFPTPIVEEIFLSVQNEAIVISYQTQYQWKLHYPQYKALKKTLEESSENRHSLFSKYGFSKQGPIFPNIFTYQFLHAGILHIFFNMFFLWLVGCNIEERWGPIIFLSLYFLGGVVAVLVQGALYPQYQEPSIGASGAVAAIMGAFLIRYAFIKIRIFYFLLLSIYPRFGVFEMPAWIAVSLWFFQQLFMGLMTLKYTPKVGYWAHIAGFIFGVGGGILIRTFRIGKRWEDVFEQTPDRLELKVEKGISASFLNDFQKARRIFDEIIAICPEHIKAREGLLRVYERENNQLSFCQTAIELMKRAEDKEDIVLINEILDRTKIVIRKAELSDFLFFQIASFYEKAQRWKEAVQTYQHILEKFNKSVYLPKVLFAVGKILKERLHRSQEAKQYFEKLTYSPYDLEWGTIAREYIKD
ncbi:rhomboid family intramembrane serine protease [bacterium]|nr:rhomboid family intramembrane serine protease [bacterium]